MSDATRGLRSSLNARLLACDEAELRAVDAYQCAIEQLRDIATPRLQIDIARERLDASPPGIDRERAALAFTVAVTDERRRRAAQFTIEPLVFRGSRADAVALVKQLEEIQSNTPLILFCDRDEPDPDADAFGPDDPLDGAVP